MTTRKRIGDENRVVVWSTAKRAVIDALLGQVDDKVAKRDTLARTLSDDPTLDVGELLDEASAVWDGGGPIFTRATISRVGLALWQELGEDGHWRSKRRSVV